jgi:hypothetical protein
MSLSLTVSLTTIANVNDPLLALDTMGDVTQIEMILMDHLN